MLKRNFELRTMARVSLSGQWLTAALVTLIYVLIAGGCGAIPFVGSLLSFLIVAPLVYGYNVFFWNFTVKTNQWNWLGFSTDLMISDALAEP